MLQKSQVIYEDNDVIVVYKPAGLATQTAKVGQSDLVSDVKNYIKKNGQNQDSEPYVALIHRLDQPVEGLLIFAKTQTAAAHLSKQITENLMQKHYLAVVCGQLPYYRATVVDYLLKDDRTNLSRIVEQGTEGAKKSVLEYEARKETELSSEKLHLLDIHLVTGRHHQIRVQMSGLGVPLLGDLKYGNEDTEALTSELNLRTVALCSYKLSFLHPATEERMEFEVEPKGAWYRLFAD